MLSDIDINFYLELDPFGVNTTELVLSVKHIVCVGGGLGRGRLEEK